MSRERNQKFLGYHGNDRLFSLPPLFLWHGHQESQRRYKCTYTHSALSPGKKFISTLVSLGWVLWSRGCVSVRLFSPPCGMALQLQPFFPCYALRSTISPQIPWKKNSFWNQIHCVAPQITTNSLSPGSGFTTPPHSFYIQFVKWEVFVKDVFNGVTGVWQVINKTNHWAQRWERGDIIARELCFLGSEDLIWITIWM